MKLDINDALWQPEDDLVRTALTDDDGHFDEVTLVHIVIVPVLDTVEQRVLFEDTVFVEIAESVIVSVAKEDKVGDIVPETLVVALTE